MNVKPEGATRPGQRTAVFEIRVNGELIATTGVGEVGSLTAAVDWRGEWWRWFQGDEYVLTLGGCDAAGKEVRWSAPALRPGDEIAIRLVEVESVDPPTEPSPHRPSIGRQPG